MGKAGVLAAFMMALAAVPAVAEDSGQPAGLPVDLGTYTCAWFLSDVAAVQQKGLAGFDRVVPAVGTIGAAIGYFQATADQQGVAGTVNKDSLLMLMQAVRENCTSRPNDLVIDVVRDIGKRLDAS